MTPVPDPYQALQLPHNATAAQIKRSYRELARKYHPDRCQNPSQPPRSTHEHDEAVSDTKKDGDEVVEDALARQRDQATAKFAAISSAYAILSDPQRKAQYDHVYKYGGYDDNDDDDDIVVGNHEEAKGGDRRASAAAASAGVKSSSGSAPKTATTRKRKSTGIGYTCVDPLAFLWTHGRVQAKMAVAGIQLPSRLNPTAPASASGNGGGGGLGIDPPSNGFRFAFSSAHLSSSPSGTTKVWQSKTTSYSQGQKYTRVETTTIHPDGRTETVVHHNPEEEENDRDGLRPTSFFASSPPFFSFGRVGSNNNDDHNNDQHSAAARTTAPWYAHAWSGIKDKIMMCYSPCTVTAVQ